MPGGNLTPQEQKPVQKPTDLVTTSNRSLLAKIQESHVLELVRILRGKTYARFAGLLVIVGGGLASTSGWFDLLIQFFGYAPSTAPWWAPFAVGSVMIGAGVYIFIHFYGKENPPAKEGAVNAVIPDRYPFDDAVRAVGDACGKAIVLENFSDKQRAAPLRSFDLKCDSISEALNILCSLADGVVPKFEIEESGQTLVLKAKTP